MATTRATKETLFLRRDFTPDERLEMGRDLAQAHNRVAAIDDEEKSMKATVKEKKTGVELTIGSLSRKLNDGYEMANVTCTLHWDSPNIGEVTYRDPLGNEVKTRAMTIEERQEELPFEESAANINSFLGNLDVTPEPEFDDAGNGPVVVVPPEQSAANVEEFFGKQDETATDQPDPIEEAVAQEPALPETFESEVRESMGVPEPFPATLKDQLAQAENTSSDDAIWQAALKTLKNHPKVTAGLFQRELHVSYVQATHLIDRMEDDKLIDKTGTRLTVKKKSGPKELAAEHQKQMGAESNKQSPDDEVW